MDGQGVFSKLKVSGRNDIQYRDAHKRGAELNAELWPVAVPDKASMP